MQYLETTKPRQRAERNTPLEITQVEVEVLAWEILIRASKSV